MKKFYLMAVFVGAFLVVGIFLAVRPLRIGWLDSFHKKHFTVGLLTYTATDEQIANGFKQGLNRLAQEKGFTVSYVGSFVTFSDDALKRAAKGLVDAHSDLIFTSENGISYIRSFDKNIPIISKLSAAESDIPVTTGFDARSANVTYISTGGDLVAGDRLFYLKQLLPNAKRILVPYQPINTPGSNPTALKILREQANQMGMVLVEKQFTSRDDLNHFMLALDPTSVDAIYRFPDNFISENYDVLFQLARQPKINLPIIGSSRKSLDDGAVLSYGFSPFNFGKDSADVAYKILVKNVPADLIPTQHTYHFELSVNLPVAHDLHIIVPATLLNQADIVIK